MGHTITICTAPAHIPAKTLLNTLKVSCAFLLSRVWMRDSTPNTVALIAPYPRSGTIKPLKKLLIYAFYGCMRKNYFAYFLFFHNVLCKILFALVFAFEPAC